METFMVMKIKQRPQPLRHLSLMTRDQPLVAPICVPPGEPLSNICSLGYQLQARRTRKLRIIRQAEQSATATFESNRRQSRPTTQDFAFFVAKHLQPGRRPSQTLPTVSL